MVEIESVSLRASIEIHSAHLEPNIMQCKECIMVFVLICGTLGE